MAMSPHRQSDKAEKQFEKAEKLQKNQKGY
jgi:hypothetical protein